ncbi:hypothetical protein WDW37_18860 [Bdellovibrionota bacterium FG-1]
MRALLFLLSLLIPIATRAESAADYDRAARAPVLSLEAVLDEAKKAGETPDGCSVYGDIYSKDYYTQADFILKEGTWNSKIGCHPWSKANLCKQARHQCTDPSCLESSSLIQDRRFKSVQLRKKIFGFTQARFEELRSDPSLQSRCCADNNACIDRFKTTQLLVLRGLGKSDLHYFYNFGRHAITASEAALLNCQNRQCIETSLLHELGHSCQSSRHSAKDQELLPKTTCDVFAGPPVSDLETLKVTGTCLLNSLKRKAAARKNKKQPTCDNDWLKEAFADAIFSFQRTDVTQWSWDCNVEEDELHGPSAMMIACLLQQPELKAKFCPK